MQKEKKKKKNKEKKKENQFEIHKILRNNKEKKRRQKWQFSGIIQAYAGIQISPQPFWFDKAGGQTSECFLCSDMDLKLLFVVLWERKRQ